MFIIDRLKRCLGLVLTLSVFVTSMTGELLSAGTCEAAVLPAPTSVIARSRTYEAPLLKGIRFDPQHPFDLTFFIDGADATDVTKYQAKKLIEYFMAALTMPQEDIWVNLSPYEQDRMIPDALSKTSLGRDLLEQDYLLKLFSASMTHPDSESGREYWTQLYAASGDQKPAFNKVFVVPQQYEVLVDGNTACIGTTSLEVLLESDLHARRESGIHLSAPRHHEDAARLMRENVLPKISDDVQTGGRFAYLRQIFNSIALAIWFKQTYGAVYGSYVDGRHIAGIEHGDAAYAQNIFSMYARSFERGVYSCVRQSTENGKRVARQYFSGGVYLPKNFVRSRAASVDLSSSLGRNGYEVEAHLTAVGNPPRRAGSPLKFLIPVLFFARLAAAQVGLFDTVQSLPLPGPRVLVEQLVHAPVAVKKKQTVLPAAKVDTVPAQAAQVQLPSVIPPPVVPLAVQAAPAAVVTPPLVSANLNPKLTVTNIPKVSRASGDVRVGLLAGLIGLTTFFAGRFTRRRKMADTTTDAAHAGAVPLKAVLQKHVDAAASADDNLQKFSAILTDVLGSVKGLTTASVDLRNVLCVIEQNYVKVIVDGIHTDGAEDEIRHALREALRKGVLTFVLVKDDASQVQVDLSDVDIDFYSQTVLRFKLKDANYDPAKKTRFCIVEEGMLIPSAVFEVGDENQETTLNKEMDFVINSTQLSEMMLRDNINDLRAHLKAITLYAMGDNYGDILKRHGNIYDSSVALADRLIKTVSRRDMMDDDSRRDVGKIFLAYAEQYMRIARYAELMIRAAESYTAIETARRNWFTKNRWFEKVGLAKKIRWVLGFSQIEKTFADDIHRMIPQIVSLGNDIVKGMYVPGQDDSGKTIDAVTNAERSIKRAVETKLRTYAGKVEDHTRNRRLFSPLFWTFVPPTVYFAVKAAVAFVVKVAAAFAVSATTVTAFSLTLPVVGVLLGGISGVFFLKIAHELFQVDALREVRDHSSAQMLKTTGEMNELIKSFSNIHAQVNTGDGSLQRQKDAIAKRIDRYVPRSDVNYVADRFHFVMSFFSPIGFVAQAYRARTSPVRKLFGAAEKESSRKGILAEHFERMTKLASDKERRERSVDYVYVISRDPSKDAELTETIRTALHHDADVRIFHETSIAPALGGRVDVRTMLDVYAQVQPGKRGVILDLANVDDSSKAMHMRFNTRTFTGRLIDYKLLTGVRFCQKLKDRQSGGFAVIGGNRLYVGPVFTKDGVNGHFVWTKKKDASRGSFFTRTRDGFEFFRDLDVSDRNNWKKFVHDGTLDRFDFTNEDSLQFLKRAPLTTYVGDVERYQGYFKELKAAVEAFDRERAAGKKPKLAMEQEVFFSVPFVRSLLRQGDISQDIAVLQTAEKKLDPDQKRMIDDVYNVMQSLDKKYFREQQYSFNFEIPAEDESALYYPDHPDAEKNFEKLRLDLGQSAIPENMRIGGSQRSSSSVVVSQNAGKIPRKTYGGVTLDRMRVISRGEVRRVPQIVGAGGESGFSVTIVSLKRFAG